MNRAEIESVLERWCRSSTGATLEVSRAFAREFASDALELYEGSFARATPDETSWGDPEGAGYDPLDAQQLREALRRIERAGEKRIWWQREGKGLVGRLFLRMGGRITFEDAAALVRKTPRRHERAR